MDILDQADEAQAVFLREALSKIARPAAPHGIGLCINCGAPVEGEARWCDAECRKDWEKYGRK